MRKIHIQYPRRQVGMKVYDGGQVAPAVQGEPSRRYPRDLRVASVAATTTFRPSRATQRARDVHATGVFRPGPAALSVVLRGDDHLLHVLLHLQRCVQADDVADNLKNQNGFVPGIRPGQEDRRVPGLCGEPLLVLGSAYLRLVVLLPEILRGQFAIPFYFGGTSVLIVVSVTMDTIQQVQSHLLAHQYEGLIEKSQLRGKGGKA